MKHEAWWAVGASAPAGYGSSVTYWGLQVFVVPGTGVWVHTAQEGAEGPPHFLEQEEGPAQADTGVTRAPGAQVTAGHSRARRQTAADWVGVRPCL